MQGLGGGAAGLNAGAGMSGNSNSGGTMPSPAISSLLVGAGVGILTASVTGWADIFVKGGHGGGAQGLSGLGGIGAAAYKRVYVMAGQTFAYIAGTDGVFDDGSLANSASDGGVSEVSLPDGGVVRATGGFGAGSDQGPRNGDGTASGGDINRTGPSAAFNDLVSPLSWSGPGVLIVIGKNAL